MRLLFIALCFLFTGATLPPRYKAYCDKHKLKANLLEQNIGVPTSIQFAQAIIECSCGKSHLAQTANNHFGIKCGDHWAGDSYILF